MGRGDPTVPVVESWTILSMAAAQTSRVTVGPFVMNVMNRHPALVARMASTLQIASGGRLILGIGIGGAPKEHAAYGMDFPPAPQRVARLEEAVAVIRALWTGGPVTRPSLFYPLTDAVAFPVPDPPPPIIIGGETRGRGTAGRTDRRRLVGVRRQLRAAPAALPRVARGLGEATRGPDRPRRVPGGVALRREHPRHALDRGAARDLGAMARGRSRRRDRAGPHDGRRRRARGGNEPLVTAVHGTIPG